MLGWLGFWTVIVLAYAGLLIAAVGAIAILRPLKRLRIATRPAAVRVALAGAAITALALVLPDGRAHAVGDPRTELDRFTPIYQFNEVHTTRVRASPDAVYRAIRAVTADEIVLFRTLTWIRSPRLVRRAESILNPERTTPILDVALRTSFVLLADMPARELVVGTIVCCRRPPPVATPEAFRQLAEPGFAKATMNFLVEADGEGWTRVTTETRVFATNGAARRRFTMYWRVIYPGSALIRRTWLAAIRRRAERDERTERPRRSETRT